MIPPVLLQAESPFWIEAILERNVAMYLRSNEVALEGAGSMTDRGDFLTVPGFIYVAPQASEHNQALETPWSRKLQSSM